MRSVGKSVLAKWHFKWLRMFLTKLFCNVHNKVLNILLVCNECFIQFYSVADYYTTQGQTLASLTQTHAFFNKSAVIMFLQPGCSPCQLQILPK